MLLTAIIFAQKADSLTVKEEGILIIKDSLTYGENYDPLAPQRAAFYSAVLPGLGQAYNKKYWKIPIIYAGMATGVYFYLQNDKDYDRFRNAYKRRLAGFTDDEFYGDNEGLVIAEIELEHEDETFLRPNWLGKEVTGITKYYNSQLSKSPFKSWE